ncbi:hypothetical protein H6G73_19745 [Richelia sinica FACHB-800]|nr:hypothetical protein [Richelia sinica FACHB-800]
MYVAMTRAIDQLIITCYQSSEFTNRVKSALSKVAG